MFHNPELHSEYLRPHHEMEDKTWLPYELSATKFEPEEMEAKDSGPRGELPAIIPGELPVEDPGTLPVEAPGEDISPTEHSADSSRQ